MLIAFVLTDRYSSHPYWTQMRSERGIRASQTNGALSKGPKTAEGRRRSAKNKVRHGLLAQTIVLDDEDHTAFLELLADFEAEYSPQTKSDSVLVEHLAAATWRLMRIWAIERAGLVLEIKKQDRSTHDAATRASIAFKTLSDDSRYLELLHRYETRYDRQYARAYKLLNSRTSNLPCEPNPDNGKPANWPNVVPSSLDERKAKLANTSPIVPPSEQTKINDIPPISPTTEQPKINDSPSDSPTTEETKINHSPPISPTTEQTKIDHPPVSCITEQTKIDAPPPIPPTTVQTKIGDTPGSSPHHPQPSPITGVSPISPEESTA
jgi:hypothetical protein